MRIKDKKNYYYSDTRNFSKSNVSNFMEKHHIAKYQDLIRKSTKNIDWYWDAVNKDLSLNWFKDYSYVVDSSEGVEKSKWFVDGKCNIISNAIDRHLNESADKLAFIFENEKGDVRSFTYAEIDYHISALALALKSHGIAKGDIVGIYLPVIPEAIFSILACSKIGAVHNTIFSGHGEEALASRLNESRAKLLITVNEMERKGSKINLKKNWLFGLGREELRGIIVVDQNENNTESQNVVGYDNFVSKFLGHDCKTEVMNSEDPLFILYTSGTTGKPKAVIHTHGGFMIVSAQQACYVIDMKKEDILFWYADIGWITGQTWTIYGSTIAGSTSVLYDGMLTYPVPDQWCKVIQKYNVSIFGASPTAIRLFMRDNNNFNYIDSYDFHSLRILATTGEPINKEAWIWYYNNVGKGEIPLINLSGGTEIGGAILSTTFLECMKPCSVGFPIPGFDASVFDDAGNETKNGILVIKKPWPSMTRGLVNDYDKFIKNYWSRYKNTWFHGDTVEIDSDGYWYITGRIDDVIKVSGHRLGSNEIENILMSNELVSEAIAVGIPDDIKGEAIACFIIPKKESINEKLLSSVLVSLLEKKIGKYARPKYIRFVKDLPRTKSGKLMRRLVRLMILKIEIPDKDLLVIDNPESVRNTSINSFPLIL